MNKNTFNKISGYINYYEIPRSFIILRKLYIPLKKEYIIETIIHSSNKYKLPSRYFIENHLKNGVFNIYHSNYNDPMSSRIVKTVEFDWLDEIRLANCIDEGKFYVNTKNQGRIDKILKDSSEYFWNVKRKDLHF